MSDDGQNQPPKNEADHQPQEPSYKNPLSEDDIRKFYPLSLAAPEAGTFEIALVLGGTVSAGAYTAGVLDYLTEALDAWQQAKSEKKDVPPHKVVIRVIAGASGGGINGILLGRTVQFKSERGPDKSNPLYRAWTSILVDHLLEVPNTKTFKSVFDTTARDKLAQDMCNWGVPDPNAQQVSAAMPGPARPWLSKELRVFTTVTNLTGFPYKIDMSGPSKLSHCMSTMADWVRFKVAVPGGTLDDIRTNWTDDEFDLRSTAFGAWLSAEQACLATSAFPGAFPARQITRPAHFVSQRFCAMPGYVDPSPPPAGTVISAKISQLMPNWDALPVDQTPPVTVSLNIDGGACNNEPLDIARRVLAGYDGRSPRQGNQAYRATILIDPFSDNEEAGPQVQDNIFTPLKRVIGGLISQARFKPEDLAMAQDPNIYSRFLIAPVGPGKAPTPNADKTSPAIGMKALASGTLGAFSGFFDESFVDYDFKLGRQNAQSFLQHHFMMPASNPLFKGWSPAAMANNDWTDTETDPATNQQTLYCSIIPLMPEAIYPSTMPFLPKISDKRLKSIYGKMSGRLDWVYDRLKESILNAAPAWLRPILSVYIWPIGFGAKKVIMSALKTMIDNSMTKQGIK